MNRANLNTCRIQPRSPEFRIRRQCFALAALSILVAGATASLAKDRIESVLPSPPSDFSIDKAEGRQSDDVYVIYVRKDRHLTEVSASVTIHYVTGGKSVVAQSWSKWLGGEKKTFSNSGFRNGRIQKVRLSGIAKEHSFKDGKETVKMVAFTESKSF